MQAKLIPADGGEPIIINRDITVVGRKDGLCDLVLDRTNISKLHCMIVRTDGLLYIRDLASTNGTKVNGQKVTRGALLPGDEIAFASVKFRVYLGPGEQEHGPEEATEMLTSLPDEPIFDEEDSDSDSDVQLLPDDSVV